MGALGDTARQGRHHSQWAIVLNILPLGTQPIDEFPIKEMRVFLGKLSFGQYKNSFWEMWALGDTARQGRRHSQWAIVLKE